MSSSACNARIDNSAICGISDINVRKTLGNKAEPRVFIDLFNNGNET